MTATTVFTHPAPLPYTVPEVPTGATYPAPLLYTIPEAMAMLRMSRTTIYAQIRAQRLHIVKQGTATRITAADLAEYVQLLKREAEAAR